MEKTKKKLYTIGEEIFNAITHGAGAALSIAGLVILLVFASKQHDGVKIVSSAIYGSTLILMFLMSTLYHSVSAPAGKKVLRVFDHCSIFLLIAGTYTPFTLVSMNGAFGTTIFVLIWAAAIIGVILNAIDVEKFAKVSIVLYILMGWCIVFAIKPMMATIPPAGLVLLLAGGISYTVGVVFYASKKKFFHGIWHLFVLGGSICHYLVILLYVIK